MSKQAFGGGLMKELEKILEEIDETIDRYGSNPELITENLTDFCYGLNIAKDIIRKHINDGWILVEDERLWDILFEEACVEGEQAKRIYNRLKETFGGERSEMDGKF